jgi:hypothetical protein
MAGIFLKGEQEANKLNERESPATKKRWFGWMPYHRLVDQLAKIHGHQQ